MIYSDENLKEITYSGWGQLEGGFVWSISKYASLLLPIEPQNDPFGIQLVMEPFLVAGKHGQQSVEIFCNGLYVLGHSSDRQNKDIHFVEIHPSVSSFGSLKIDFIFPDAASPNALGISQDMRLLGYKIFELQLL
jgi:hypothetical protein